MTIKGPSPLLAPVLTVFFLVLACAPTISQFFPDDYFSGDHLYRNKLLGFIIRYRGNWEITTDPNKMSKAGQKAARALQEGAAELLFVGMTREGSQGTRGIVDNLNVSSEEYLKRIRAANSTQIEEDFGAVFFQTNETMMIKWQYTYQGLQYAEFLFRSGTYNVRIAFWTTPDLYTRFLSEYEAIMSSLVFETRI